MTKPRKTVGKFYWLEGVFASEVTSAMSSEYARRYRWVLTPRAQRLAAVLSVWAWVMSAYGAVDGPGSFGFGASLYSWWCLATVPSYLLLRASIRVVADAPDELIDERLVAIRDRAHLLAYRWLSLVVMVVFGVLVGISESSDTTIDGEAMVFGSFIMLFVTASLPSMVVAWQGAVGPNE